MECVAMLSNPELMAGFQELIGDADLAIVKRTIRVFSNLYHNAFRLVSTGELEEDILLKAWDPVKEVVDHLLSMISTCENEGILVHLVRFLESSVTAHLMYDLSANLEVAQKGRDVIKRGLKSLKDLVTTPYVGGSVFIVAVRSLINIACLRPDLYEPVTDLVSRQMYMLPPTLFDHNVRSFNKMLQRNLFRLIKRVECASLRAKLIEVMVKAGAPRKMLAAWAPPVEARKRSPNYRDEDRLSPPIKKVKGESDDHRGFNPVGILKNMSPEEIVRLSSDPRMINRSPPFQKSVESRSKHQQPLQPEAKTDLPKKPFSDDERELALYGSLTLSKICTLIFEGLENLPDSLPEHFVKELDDKRLVHDDLELMKKRLTSLLYNELTKEQLDSLVKFESSDSAQSQHTFPKDPPPPDSNSDLLQNDSEDSREKTPSKPTPPSTPSSTPTSTPPPADTDLRQVYLRPNKVADVDMRILDPRLSHRDPRITKNNIKDPRLSKDPDMRVMHPRDPRISVGDSRDPRSSSSRGDPRTQKMTEAQTLNFRASPTLVDSKEQRNFNSARDPRVRREHTSTNTNEFNVAGEENTKAEKIDPRLSSGENRHERKDPRVKVSESNIAKSYNNVHHNAMRDPRNKPFPTAGLLPLPEPQILQLGNIDRNADNFASTEFRDPRMRKDFLAYPPKEMLPYAHPFPFPNDHSNSTPHPLFPNGNHMMPNFSQLAQPHRLAQPLMPNCPPIHWSNNFQGDSALFLAQAVASAQGGFMPSPMLNM